jgi:phage baseplate assembly protein W
MATSRVLSREDGNLNTSTLVTTRNRVYRDIDLSFTVKDNGELYVKRDAAAVKQAIKNLILTNHYEKPFLMFYGGNLRSLLFELAYDDLNVDIENNIRRAIEKYEPRARVRKIVVNSTPDLNSLSVTIEFQIINSSEIVTFSTVLSRLR